MRSDCLGVRVGQTLDAGVVPAAGAGHAGGLVALRVARGEVRVGEARGQHGRDGRAARLGVEVAADDQHPARRPVVAGQRDHLAALAGVEVVLGLARRRARVLVARAVVGAARQVGGPEVDRPGAGGDPHPQRGAQRPGQTEALLRQHGVQGEDRFPVGARIVVPDDLVLAVADVGHALLELVEDALVRLLEADQVGARLAQLLDEERDPARQVALVAVGGAGLAVQDVLAHRVHGLRRRRGAVRSGRIVVVVAAAGREQPRHEHHREHPPHPSDAMPGA